MDVHVPASITRGLRLRQVDVLTAQEDHAARMPDDLLLDRAFLIGRTLFTQDEDLLAVAARRQRGKIPFAGVICAHQLGATIGQCVEDLEIMAKTLEPADCANSVFYLPL